MSETIYNSDFSKYLPQSLQRDPKMVAFAKAATEQMLEVSGLSDDVLIYSRIDDLPEDIVDVLAYFVPIFLCTRTLVFSKSLFAASGYE